MELKELFEMQKKLDEHIIKEKGLEGQDLLPGKILALQVELGELANEWRGFKFWSNKQEPRTEELYEITTDCECVKKGNVICTDCLNTRKIIEPGIKNPLLEEYVDCLHFILSIGLDIKDRRKDVEIEGISIKLDEIYKIEKNKTEIIKQFNEVIYWITSIDVGYLKYFAELVREFLTLGYLLGFTWEQVVQAYKDKNQVNHTRQENGY